MLGRRWNKWRRRRTLWEQRPSAVRPARVLRGLALRGRVARAHTSSLNLVIAEHQFLDFTSHLLSRCRRNLLFHFHRRPQSRIPSHESHAARVRPNINRRQICVRRNHPHPRQRASERFGRDLRRHSVRSLANFRRTRVDHNSTIAINLDVHRRVRHIRPDNRIRRPAHIVTASDPQPAALAQLAFPLLPTRTLDSLLNAFRQTIALDPQPIHRNTRRLQQIALPDLRRIHPNLCCQLIQLRFEGKSHVHRSMPSHRPTRRLIGQHPVSVILNVGNVIQRPEQRPRVQNGHHAVRAVRSAILYHASLHGSDAPILLHSSLQIDDGARPPAMRPEHLLARIGDLHRSLRLSRRNCRDDLQRNHFTLAAESAAYQRLDHPNLLHGHLEHERQLVLQVVRHLRRRPNRQPPQLARVRIEFERSQRGMRLHRRMGHFVRNEARFQYLIGFRKPRVWIAEAVVIILLQIVRLVLVDEVSLGLHRLFGIEVGRQHLVIDIDQLQRLLGNRLGRGDHARHVVPHIADFVESQRVLIMSNRKNAVRIRSISSHCHRHDTFKSLGATRVDVSDARMGIRRMKNLADQHARKTEIVRILASPSRLLRRINHRGRLADDGKIVAHPDFVIPSAARNLRSACRATSLSDSQSFTFRLNRRPDGLIHLVVASTPAQIAAQRRTDVSLRRIGILRQQRLHRHDETRRAVPALRSAPIAICLLNRRQTPMLADALNRRDLLPLAAGGQQRTRHHGHAIHQHRASAARRIITSALRSSQSKTLPQHVEQQRAGLNRNLVRAPVDSEFDKLFVHLEAFSFP